jgi:hypothetical protein
MIDITKCVNAKRKLKNECSRYNRDGFKKHQSYAYIQPVINKDNDFTCEDFIESNNKLNDIELSAFPKLCYIKNDWAYFTTANLKDQWGDDWNDRPYEHNAGEPYEWYEDRNIPEYQIIKIAFECDLVTPDYCCVNSSYSVEDINIKKKIPWLKTYDWGKEKIEIWAGTTLYEFIQTILSMGGKVYVNINELDNS